MRNIFYIAMISLCFSKNFIYSENSWYSILAPERITSISYNKDEAFFSSTNGLFIHNKNNKQFFYSDYILSDLNNKNIYVVHYDLYRDNLWILNRDELSFKSNLSTIWTKINFYNFNVSPLNIKNIGSNLDYVVIKLSNNQYIFLDPYTGLANMDINNENIQSELLSINWSSSSRDLIDFNLNNYYAFNNIEIVSNNEIKKDGKSLYITCKMDKPNGPKWIGTSTGELFFINEYSKEIQEIGSIPPILDMNVTYLDDNKAWWISSNEVISNYSDIFYTQEPIFLCNWNETLNLWTKYYQTTYPKIFSKDINDIYKLDHVLYLATNYGLVIYNIILDKWDVIDFSDGLPSNTILKIEYYNDMIYLATTNGLATVSRLTNNPINTYFHSLNRGEIYDMSFLGKYLYLLNNIGLIKMDTDSRDYSILIHQRFKKLDIKDSTIILLKNDNLYSLKNDSNLKLLINFNRLEDFDICNEYLWAHNNKSALIYNINSNYKLEYNNDDGIIGDRINYIGCDQEWVWFSTNNGISFYNWQRYHYE